MVTIWLFNIAMENPQNKWRFLAGKIIYKWAMASMAMLNDQMVINIIWVPVWQTNSLLLKITIYS